ncbi:MAG: hypothetical protein E6K10_06685 [Methanobacteriota archaeon]|nr:MAG: hypothetical protein E6K10_06685 [Euryarchaeota archaeon]
MTDGDGVEPFVRRYFEREGQPIEEEEPGVYRARLPESLRPAFGGAESIRIAFDPATAAAAGQVDLAAVGSFLLDRLVEDATRAGWHTVARVEAGPETAEQVVGRGLRPKNATLSIREPTTESVANLLFNFRVRFMTDERIDRFESILVDTRTGKERTPAASLFDERASLPEDIGFDWRGIAQAYRAACTALEGRLAPAAKAFREQAESLRKGEVDRIAAYFERSIQEVLDSKVGDGGSEVRALQLDRERRLAEAEEKHRFVGEAELCNVRTVLLDVTRADVTLSHRGAAKTIRVEFDAASREVPSLACEACGRTVAEPVLCFGGHVAGPECVHGCEFCDRVHCGRCGPSEGRIAACSTCRRGTCPDHLEVCALSRRPYCPDHIHACAICGRTVGPEYVARCESCEQRYCVVCVAPPSERCATCRGLVPAEAGDATIAALRRGDPTLSRMTKWKRGANPRYTVLLAKGLVWNSLLVVDAKGAVLVRKKVLGS